MQAKFSMQSSFWRQQDSETSNKVLDAIKDPVSNKALDSTKILASSTSCEQSSDCKQSSRCQQHTGLNNSISVCEKSSGDCVVEHQQNDHVVVHSTSTELSRGDRVVQSRQPDHEVVVRSISAALPQGGCGVQCLDSMTTGWSCVQQSLLLRAWGKRCCCVCGTSIVAACVTSCCYVRGTSVVAAYVGQVVAACSCVARPAMLLRPTVLL